MSNERELLRRIEALEKQILDKRPEIGKPFYEDLRFPATPAQLNPGLTKPDYDTTNAGLLFDPAAIEYIYIIAQMPHDWVAASTIYPHVHWMPTSTNTGDVIWNMAYKWTNIGDTDAGGATNLPVTQAGGGTALNHQVADMSGIAGTGKTSSSILSIVFSRNATAAGDTYTGDALFKEFDIRYLKDPSKSYWTGSVT